MNCIIIEDDDLTRRVVEEFVKKTKALTLIGSYQSAKKALKIPMDIAEADIIILDVEMPQMTGFQFIKHLERQPEIIIMSSKMNYAVDAFSFAVTDFLLKPISYSRFVIAIEKALSNIERKSTSIQSSAIDKILIKKNGAMYNIEFENIAYIEAMENYSIIYTSTERFVIHQAISAVEEKLPIQLFKRIHRSFIVNQKRIYKLDETSLSISYNDTLKQLPIGRKYKSSIMRYMKTI